MVASGILLSRLVGLVRNRVFAHYFGTSDAADAFNAAFRIPNFLQNLFGEGVLSASFIPVYAGLQRPGRRGRGPPSGGGRGGAARAGDGGAGARSAWLLTPWLIAIIAPGFDGEKREATIRLVRILFPGAGLLVLSAWCLGVLNSHRRFFLSYAAPVLWNLAIIASLIAFGGRRSAYDLAEIARVGLGAGQPAAVRGPDAHRDAAARRDLAATGARVGPGARGAAQFLAGVRGPRGGADQRLRRHGAREPAAHGRRGRTLATRRCCTRCR